MQLVALRFSRLQRLGPGFAVLARADKRGCGVGRGFRVPDED